MKCNFKVMMFLFGTLVLSLVLSGSGFGQTVIVAPKNNYPIEQDSIIRDKYSSEVTGTGKIYRNAELQLLVNEIGQRLVAAVPSEYPNYGFEYRFVMIKDQSINAFALPAGFVAVNTGLIAACNNTDELAAVMAHEISHVVLRHGTAAMTKDSSFSLLKVGIVLAGSMVGGSGGGAIAYGGLSALNIFELKYSREYEKQADLLGTHILVRAGYGAYNMQNVMRVIEAQSGSGGAQWLSNHPNPANRVKYLGEENKMLPAPVTPAPTHYTEFKRLQAQLAADKGKQ